MQNYNECAIQRLSETSNDMEVWWDSSPLIFKSWSQKVIDKTEDSYKEIMKKQLSKLFNYDNPLDMVFAGVTTNPRLTSKVLELIPEEVNPIVDKIIKQNPAKTDYQIAWEVYKAITAEGTKLYMPLFEKSGYKRGYVSAQVDPFQITNIREMLLQALELKKQGDNIMIKCPGSKEGIYVIEILTSLGIPTNSTLVFNIPQVVAVAESVKKGYEIGKSNAIDYSKWRSVITIMLARFEDREQFAQSAESVGIELTSELKRWAGIAIAKKALKILNDPENGYKSKLLLCSTRIGPTSDVVYHIEKIAGANMVFTINPEMIGDFNRLYREKDVASKWEEPVPEEIMNKLLKIPYFKAGYEIDGIKDTDFVNQPSFQYTANEFSGSMKFIESYVTQRKQKIK
ncbi:MAG: transaldolase [Actinobacteria bacterium]|nr:transaldolase [Cyanobacteriota bacterium]MCL5770881.1 transaldolase [Actinomycetota bacterium]